MTNPISKTPASPAHPKDSVKAVVDEHGILLGAEVEIDGVGVSLPAEQFSSMDSAMAHPKVIWVDGHTRREIFIDHVKNTSYVRSIQRNTPASECAQEVITEVHVVVTHIVTGAKAASGISSKPQAKSKKEAPPSPAENIIKGALTVETPKAEETAAVHIVTDNSFRSGLFFLESDDRTPSHFAPLSAATNSTLPNGMDNPMDHGTPASPEVSSHSIEKPDAHDTFQLLSSSPLLSGATYIWMGVQPKNGEDDRMSPLNTNSSPAALNARIAEAHTGKLPSDIARIEVKWQGPDNPLITPYAAQGDITPHPTKRMELPDKSPTVLGDETLNPVGAPVAPPPTTTAFVLAAPKLPVIKDSTLVERPSRSPGSEGDGREDRNQHGQRGGQQNSQDEYPSDPEEQLPAQ